MPAQRALNANRQGRWLRAATPLEDTNDQFLPLAFERQTQWRRRGLTGTGCRTKNEQQCATALGSKLQPTQCAALDFR